MHGHPNARFLVMTLTPLFIVAFVIVAAAGGWFVTGGPGRRQRAATGRIDRGGPLTIALVCGVMLIAIAAGVYLLITGG